MGLFGKKPQIPEKKWLESDSAYRKRLEKENGIYLKGPLESNYAFKNRVRKSKQAKEDDIRREERARWGHYS